METINNGSVLDVLTSQYVLGNLRKYTEIAEKRYEKALQSHQYTLHAWKADTGDHSGLLRSPLWDYFF